MEKPYKLIPWDRNLCKLHCKDNISMQISDPGKLNHWDGDIHTNSITDLGAQGKLNHWDGKTHTNFNHWPGKPKQITL